MNEEINKKKFKKITRDCCFVGITPGPKSHLQYFLAYFILSSLTKNCSVDQSRKKFNAIPELLSSILDQTSAYPSLKKMKKGNRRPWTE